jgi:alpha-D-ribose 1-methylphosphonate 5-triphosphate synthase subunit PhnH
MISTLSKKHSFDTVYDSQKVFRLILEAMSNPARAVNISRYAGKLCGGQPVFLAVAMTLLDNEVSFNTCGDDSLAEEITLLTLSKTEPIESADYIFACFPGKIKNLIENAKCGTLADPHKSATLIVRDGGGPVCRIKLSGPGIDGHITAEVTRTVEYAIALRDAQNYEYPQGVDMLFVSNEGRLFAIPRLTRMEDG